MGKIFATLAFGLMLASHGALSYSATPDVIIIKGTARTKLSIDATPPPLPAYAAAPRIENIALSDDGSRFAFVTRQAGLRILTVYNVDTGDSKSIRLSEDPLTAVTWIDNDHVILSSTETAVRSNCPAGNGQNLKAAQTISDYIGAMTVGGFNGGSGTDITSPNPFMAMQLQSRLTPPKCVNYGVRSNEAATIVDLGNTASISLGHRLAGDYDHMPLGLPTPVSNDGKVQLVGPFLELRDKSINGTSAQRVYLWRVDPLTGKGNILNDGAGDLDRIYSYVDDWLVDKDGQPFVKAQYNYDEESFAIEWKQAGKWKPVLKRKINANGTSFAPFLVGKGRDGVSVLMVDAVVANDGFRRYQYFELSPNGKISAPLDEDATTDRPIFDTETGVLAGFSRDGETTNFTFFDQDLADIYKYALNTAPGQTVRVATIARDPARMILFVQGGANAGSWHYYDFIKGKRVDIGRQFPLIPPEWVASQRLISYPASDGREITAQLTLPPQGEEKSRALVVLPHDGPLGHDGSTFNWFAQALASRGYVVLQPNYRGSDGNSHNLIEAGYGEWSGKMLTDLSDGVRYLVGLGMVDPKRVCISGQGYGGYAALASVKNVGQYRCAIAINGISAPGAYAALSAKYALADDIAGLKADTAQARSFRANGNSPELIKRFFGASEPAPISSAAVPVLLIHGDEDKRVPVSQSRELRDRLQRAGKGVNYVELQDCGDGLETEQCRLSTLQATLDFLETKNPSK